jgi:hypothetical protein
MQITHIAEETQESLWDLPSTDVWRQDRLGLCELVITAPPGFALGVSPDDWLSHTSALAVRVAARIYRLTIKSYPTCTAP